MELKALFHTRQQLTYKTSTIAMKGKTYLKKTVAPALNASP